MPKKKETEASYQALRFQSEPLLPSYDFHVYGIWADATVKKMEAQWLIDHPVHQGLVYKVKPNDPHEVLCGTGAHTNIYPLELKGVHNSSQAVLLDFGSTWLQVQYLTHMPIQLYCKDIWQNLVCKIPKNASDWKLGLGIEFDNYVLACVSKELLFQF
ncbi:hypothetical protein PILCRDRAFT_93052 [Piloderma croceum F 1598]|uniref:Uncharacterized protein n=1 Tax=Piloderma croceum (strain F 1598) TaxID=765440 RepID=A0A0C3F0C1_PILCF|nr:hypothetical protein PILCRDRAFT_93052 [Piloderma croceum F 1598]